MACSLQLVCDRLQRTAAALSADRHREVAAAAAAARDLFRKAEIDFFIHGW